MADVITSSGPKTEKKIEDSTSSVFVYEMCCIHDFPPFKTICCQINNRISTKTIELKLTDIYGTVGLSD